MKVSETIYFAADIDAAVRDYVDILGWTLVEQEEWGWALLERDGAKLGLLQKKLVRSFEDPPRPRVAFRTDDIEGEVARLRSAGLKVEDISGEAVRSTYFNDRDGNLFFLWDDGQPLD